MFTLGNMLFTPDKMLFTHDKMLFTHDKMLFKHDKMLFTHGKSSFSTENLTDQFQVHMEVSLGQLSRMLDTDHYVLVVHDQTQCKWSSSYFQIRWDIQIIFFHISP